MDAAIAEILRDGRFADFAKFKTERLNEFFIEFKSSKVRGKVNDSLGSNDLFQVLKNSDVAPSELPSRYRSAYCWSRSAGRTPQSQTVSFAGRLFSKTHSCRWQMN